MKKMLLLLSLIAVPAWAEDSAVASPVPQLEAMQAAPATRVAIEFKGPAKSTSALVAGLEKEAVYKEAACSKKAGKTARITCANANGRLMEFLLKNAPASVQWSTTNLTLTCLNGCVYTQCPAGSGIYRCCKLNSPCK